MFCLSFVLGVAVRAGGNCSLSVIAVYSNMLTKLMLVFICLSSYT
ncbi:hypothetical protein DSUL_60076 [Desulfovibrionales bacterium]